MSLTQLKTALHARIEAMDENSLNLAEKLFATLELEELRAQLNADFDAARRAGLLTDEKVEAAIQAARAAHPYR